MKRVLALCLCLCVCLTVFASVPAFAADTSGSCGDNASWSYDAESGTLTFSGSGAIKDYSKVTEIPWKTYCPDVKNIVIDEGITRIGNYALSWCEQVTALTLPSTVTALGKCSLGWSESLTSIVLPAGLKTIGSQAFVGCYSLETISIPASVDSIDSTAFLQCTALKSINVSADNAKYTSIDGVLYSPSEGSLLTYPAGKQDASFTVPENVSVIKESAFRENRYLTELIIGSVSKIETSAFTGCSKLYTVELGSVGEIADMAFYGCESMVKINIPANTASVGEKAFRGCTNLQLVTFLNDNTQIGADAFKDDKYVALVANINSTARNYCAQTGIAFDSIAYVIYNGTAVNFDPMAFVINDARTMVPMRAVFEMMGATVDWDESTNTAIASKDGITVSIRINSDVLYKNGEAIVLDETGKLIADKTYVPLRAVTEAFGNTVEWIDETNTVNIY